MKVRLLIIILLGMFGADLHARQLSPSTKISLLSCAPGAELYSGFGHSAIRIHDPETGLDRVYNYGTFDFSTNNFYLKFVQRELDYYLNAYPFSYFVREYQYFKRSFDEQVLNLSSAQTQSIYDFLEDNCKEDKKFYRYDFFFDNCATRIRDVFFQSLGDEINLPEKDQASDQTFRQLIDVYMEKSSWADFGIDLALGAVIDQAATKWDAMFLPDYLASGFGESQKLDSTGIADFVSLQQNLYKADSPQKPTPIYLKPIVVFSSLLLIIVFFSVKNWTKHPRRHIPDGILFFLMGLAGILLLLLWFATDHIATKSNWNLMWLLPTHLIAGIALFSSRPSTWLKYYLGATAILNIGTLMGWMIIPQEFHIAFLPLILISLVRSAILYKKFTSPKSEQIQKSDPISD